MPELNILEILDVLPHRFPMLMVDRILSLEGTAMTAIKNVSVNEWFFQGHYPGKPIMPGVLIVEAMAQAGAVLILLQPEHKGKIPLIGSIENARFKQPVVPGDQIVMELELVNMKGSIGKMRSSAKVDGRLVASMELMFKVMEREQE